MKKILKIFCLLSVIFSSVFVCDASSIYWEDNILSNAYALRRETLLQLVGWWTLENEINSLKTELEKLVVDNDINEEAKDRIQKSIEDLETELINLNEELVANIENSTEFDELLLKYNDEIALKKELVEELNNSIRENDINLEKINLLIETYLQEKERLDETQAKNMWWKILIFVGITLFVLLIYTFSTYLSREKRISTKRFVYINFFLAFAYIIFLISFFFYLYPQFSVFLIFMSWYMLVINSHLIGSFIWSIIVLQRFKVWEVIKSWWTYGRISNITPLYIILSPLTEDWVYDTKSTYIPHINILKESISKDKIPELLIHTFKVTIKEDSDVDVMKFLQEVETNILQKFLHNKLRSLAGSNDFYRISFDFTTTAHLVIIFVWKADALLSNKVERKIIWHLSKTKSILKKQKDEKNIETKTTDENIDFKLEEEKKEEDTK